MKNNRNAEGYYDPTAGIAIARALRAKKQTRHIKIKYHPMVYICSPYSGDVVRNILAAQKYCRFAVKSGFMPVAAHLHYPQFLSDENPMERELGMYFGNILMDKCDEVWVFGERFSEGMEDEYNRAMKHGYKVRRFTNDCQEMPNEIGGGGDGSV